MLYQLSVFIHVLSAIFWIGGMLFTAAVLVPASRHKLLIDRKGTLFTVIGKKFSSISWFLFLILMITGVTNLLTRGYEFSNLFATEFWSTGLGTMLYYKLWLFAGVLIISGIHDFYAGPKASELMDSEPQSQRTQRMRKLTSWLGRLNLLLGLGILYFAIRLLRG